MQIDAGWCDNVDTTDGPVSKWEEVQLGDVRIGYGPNFELVSEVGETFVKPWLQYRLYVAAGNHIRTRTNSYPSWLCNKSVVTSHCNRFLRILCSCTAPDTSPRELSATTQFLCDSRGASLTVSWATLWSVAYAFSAPTGSVKSAN